MDQAKQIHQCAIKNAGSASLDPAYAIIFRKEWVVLCTMKDLTFIPIIPVVSVVVNKSVFGLCLSRNVVRRVVNVV